METLKKIRWIYFFRSNICTSLNWKIEVRLTSPSSSTFLFKISIIRSISRASHFEISALIPLTVKICARVYSVRLADNHEALTLFENFITLVMRGGRSSESHAPFFLFANNSPRCKRNGNFRLYCQCKRLNLVVFALTIIAIFSRFHDRRVKACASAYFISVPRESFP